MPDRLGLISCDMLAGMKMMLIADASPEVGEVAACFLSAGCDVAVSFVDNDVANDLFLPEPIKVYSKSLTSSVDIAQLSSWVQTQLGEPDILTV